MMLSLPAISARPRPAFARGPTRSEGGISCCCYSGARASGIRSGHLLSPVSTGNSKPQEFLHAPALDPPCVAKLSHKFLHFQKILLEDRHHAATTIGSY